MSKQNKKTKFNFVKTQTNTYFKRKQINQSFMFKIIKAFLFLLLLVLSLGLLMGGTCYTTLLFTSLNTCEKWELLYRRFTLCLKRGSFSNLQKKKHIQTIVHFPMFVFLDILEYIQIYTRIKFGIFLLILHCFMLQQIQYKINQTELFCWNQLSTKLLSSS